MSQENTSLFSVQEIDAEMTRVTLREVYEALEERGYNPVNQIVGYIMSGDPTYITSHNGARKLISKMERDELVEAMLKSYIEHQDWE